MKVNESVCPNMFHYSIPHSTSPAILDCNIRLGKCLWEWACHQKGCSWNDACGCASGVLLSLPEARDENIRVKKTLIHKNTQKNPPHAQKSTLLSVYTIAANQEYFFFKVLEELWSGEEPGKPNLMTHWGFYEVSWHPLLWQTKHPAEMRSHSIKYRRIRALEVANDKDITVC